MPVFGTWADCLHGLVRGGSQWILRIRRPLPTARGARQRSNSTQQVVHAASVKVPMQEQKCLASLNKGKGDSNQAARARSKRARSKEEEEGGEEEEAEAIMGCRPRARSVLHCHFALALRHRPWTRAVPDESHLQDAASNLEAGSAERQVKARFEASF